MNFAFSQMIDLLKGNKETLENTRACSKEDDNTWKSFPKNVKKRLELKQPAVC